MPDYYLIDKEGEGEMTDILDFYIKKYGEQYGKQYGEALAEQKSKEVAEEAAKKAAHRENIAFATNLLNSGMNVEFIAQNTKLSIPQAVIRPLTKGFVR